MKKNPQRTFIFVLIASLFFLFSGEKLAEGDPVTISVGDGTFDGSFLKPYTNLWRLTYTKPGHEASVVALWSDQGEAVMIGGRPAMKRTQVAKYDKPKGLISTVVNVFDLATMAPLSLDFSRNDNGAYNHREVHGALIHFRRADSQEGEVHQGDVKLSVKAFDFFAGMYGLLLVTGPLRQGYTATFPSSAEDGERLRWATYEVTGKEMVTMGKEKHAEAWVIKTDDNGPMTFWLTKEPPYIIKLVYTNKDGVTATYEMI